MSRLEATMAGADCGIRAVVPNDLDALLALCDEHARYERAGSIAVENPGLKARLSSLLFADPPRLWAWIAEDRSGPLGYASASSEVSTWRASEYVHLDCLYLRDGQRGRGIGAALLRAVIAHARALGASQLQWQTPDWNQDAARFYRRHGASEAFKRRYTLDLDTPPAPTIP